MKKVVFFAIAAAIMAVSCSKTEPKAPKQNVIGFQPANSLATKAIEGSVFPTTDVFGTYAWVNGEDGEVFIDNDKVAYDEDHSVWTTVNNTYYWPKNESLDFISYYPYNVEGVTIARKQINYNLDFYTANGSNNKGIDFMYADKAVGFTDNADEVSNGTQNAYEGVPTIFRHAGAKVRVVVVLGENEKVEAATGTKTKWEVKLKKAILTDIYSKGTCVLNLATSPVTGVVGWVKPEGNVWTPDVTVKRNYESFFNQVISLNTGNEVIPYTFVLPQALATEQQKIYLELEIKTWRASAGEDYAEEPTLTQPSVNVSADLLIRDNNGIAVVDKWQMNQAITYTITLGPAGKQITFDPAIINWDNKVYDTNIELEI